MCFEFFVSFCPWCTLPITNVSWDRLQHSRNPVEGLSSGERTDEPNVTSCWESDFRYSEALQRAQQVNPIDGFSQSGFFTTWGLSYGNTTDISSTFMLIWNQKLKLIQASSRRSNNLIYWSCVYIFGIDMS